MNTTQDRNRKPIIIAGPCSAENEKQIFNITESLAATGRIDYLRAGVWKPRTRPGHFEGIGDEALLWLQEAAEQYGLPYCTEVADARQLEHAILRGAAMVWIGARTTASPFAVQQLADAMRGIDIPVYIKNPTNPDLELWIGAVERIGKEAHKLGLIHRGFTIYGAKDYRNPPMYDIAIEMKRRYQELPFLMDPSHIGGVRKLIRPLLQHAIDLDYDGMMVEVHPNPDQALSDAAQQLTPEDFIAIIEHLEWKSNHCMTPEQAAALHKYRSEIDKIDAEMINLLDKRMKIAKEIGVYKSHERITILQTDRLNEVRKNILHIGQSLGLSPDFLKQYISAIHLESIKQQQGEL